MENCKNPDSFEEICVKCNKCGRFDKEKQIEVVRCKDCAVPHNKWTGCPKLGGLVPPDDFYCAFGERFGEIKQADCLKLKPTEEHRMFEMYKDLLEIFDEEYEKRLIISADFTAVRLAEKGYHKQSEAEWVDRQEKTWCSLCGASNKRYKPPFCPHCGAKMKGGEGDG